MRGQVLSTAKDVPHLAGRTINELLRITKPGTRRKVRSPIARNVASEAWQWLGNVLWVDSRFARELVDGLLLEARH
jgi:hypothetical protein